ncbi:MAG: cytochrome c3 family protein [Chloroflexi bacterium]|nr:cytochrome c3 family protein [Chloroflexota bacterium]
MAAPRTDRLRRNWPIFGLVPAIGLAALAFVAPRAAAAPPAQGVSNDTCLACHASPALSLAMGNGGTLPLTIDESKFHSSVHGEAGLNCVDCHKTISEYPHPKFTAADRRDATLQLYTACRQCHAEQYERTLDSVHQRALAGGNREAAVCTDCHTAHAVQRVTNPNDRKQLTAEARQRIPQTCARCHNAIFEKYKKSVHGAALLENINPDVPTCIDCHGVHNIGDPTTAAFRLKSPQICAKCHTDPARMSKYGISTQVLTTYVADFHGTTVTLFEKQTPDAQTNKPVCYDCHGIHDISRVDDPQKGLEIKQNLLTRCQRCHPDATSNFPDAWLSHYIPSPEKTPLVYYVNLFYRIFIPALLGGMTVLVVLDAARRIYEKAEGRKGKGEGRYAKMKDEAESSKS